MSTTNSSNHTVDCSLSATPWPSLTDNFPDHRKENNATLEHIFYQPFEFKARITVLWVLAITGILGNSLVMVWLCGNSWNKRRAMGRRRATMSAVVANLAIADAMVVVCATCSQLAWEYESTLRAWRHGDVTCRLFKFAQIMSISASNYNVVALAVDRLCAVRRPLRDQLTALHLCGTAWCVAVIVSFSNLFLFKTTCLEGTIVCRNILLDYPRAHLKAYLTIMAILMVFLPFLAILLSYSCIFKKFVDRVSNGHVKPGKIKLQATSSNFQSAKKKTLKMTVSIVVLFLACNTPYFICDIWRVYFDSSAMSSTAYAILGALAVSNSSVNPYIFLAFNIRTFSMPTKSSSTSYSRTTVTRTRSRGNHANDVHTEAIALK